MVLEDAKGLYKYARTISLINSGWHLSLVRKLESNLGIGQSSSSYSTMLSLKSELNISRHPSQLH